MTPGCPLDEVLSRRAVRHTLNRDLESNTPPNAKPFEIVFIAGHHQLVPCNEGRPPMVRSEQRLGCLSFIAVLLIIFGIVQLVIYFNPSIVANATAAVQNVQPTCNGEPMSPGDVCEVYENGALVRTDSYEDRLAAAQGSDGYWAQFTVTLAQPGADIFGLLALSIGLLILLPTTLKSIRKARTTY